MLSNPIVPQADGFPQVSDATAYNQVLRDMGTAELRAIELRDLVSSGDLSLDDAVDQLKQWCVDQNLHSKAVPGAVRKLKEDAERIARVKARMEGKPSPSPAPVQPVEPSTTEQVKQQLERLILEDAKDSDIQAAIAELSKHHGIPPHQIKSIYQALANDTELLAATARAGSDLQQLAAVRGTRLPIEAGLFGDGGQLATKIRQVAEAMPTAPEFLVTTLIPVLATAMGTAQTLVIHATAGYTAEAIFRSIVVAPTGRKKTPAQMAIIKALTELETEAHWQYDLAMAAYEADHRAWLKATRAGETLDEPVRPTRTRYLTKDSTLAARVQIHAENPRGLLLYKDEASAFITERGRFTSGKGDGGEFEADLEEFNGGSIMCDRKGEGSTFLAKSAINRVGATQYSTLQKLMGNHEDDCGEWARYLFCAADAPPSKIDLNKDMGDIGLTSDVMALFTRLSEMPEQAYLLSPAAKQAFQAYQHELTDRAVAEDHPSMQAAYPKFEKYFGRFILWLHLVNAALAGQTPSATVDRSIVELARQWTEYFIAQLKLVLAINSPQQELTGDLLKVYNHLKGKDKPLAAREIAQCKLFRKDDKSKQGTSYLKQLLTSLVDQGWIVEQEGLYRVNFVGNPSEPVNIPTGQGLEAPNGQDVGVNVGNLLKNCWQGQSLTGQGLEAPKMQNVGMLAKDSNKNKKQEAEATSSGGAA